MTSHLVFDDARYAALSSPGDREMFLFKWLSNLDAHLEAGATTESLKDCQRRLEQILLEIAMIPPATHNKTSSRLSWLGGNTSPNPAPGTSKPTILQQVPKPTRVTRDLIAKCLARLYEISDVRTLGGTLGETLDAIQGVMQAKKKMVEREARLAGFVCAGVLFEALGNKAGFRLLSCFNDFVAIALKVIKTNGEDISVRVEATRMLSKLLQGGGKTAKEIQARDIIKCVKPNLQHKSPLLVLATLNVFESLVFFTTFMLPEAQFDAESFITSSLQDLLASTVLVVRRAAARLVAILISNTITLSTATADTAAEAPAAKIADPAIRAIAKSAGYQLKSASTNTSVRNSMEESARAASKSPEPSRRMTPSPVSPIDRSNSDAGATKELPTGRGRRGTVSMVRPSEGGLVTIPGTRSSNDLTAQAATAVKSAAVSAATAVAEAFGNGVSLARALTWLSSLFVRANSSRELRAGIIDAYAALFEELGTNVVEAHYAVILNHILVDLASATQVPGSSALDTQTRAARPGLTHAIGTPSNINSSAFPENSGENTIGLIGAFDARAEADILALRNMCSWLLRVPIAQALLTENGKTKAARIIWNNWLTGSLPPDVRAMIEGNSSTTSIADVAAAMFAWKPAPGTSTGGSEVALLVVLQEWRMLIEDLGESCQSLNIFHPAPNEANDSYYSDASKNSWMVPLENWLGYPNEAVRISAAACLGSLMRYDRLHMSRVVATLVSRFQQFCAHCTAHGNPSIDAMKRCIGYAYGIAAVISVNAALKDSHASLLSVPLDLVEWIHSIALRLLNAAYRRSEPEIIDSGNGNTNSSSKVVGGVSSADPANINAALGTAPPQGREQQAAMRRQSMTKPRPSQAAALQNMRMAAGWVLLTGLTSLGTDFIANKARSDWLPLWALAMPQPDSVSSSGFVTSDMPWHVRAHQLQSRFMALTHFLAYRRVTTSGLDDTEAKQLLTCLRFTLMFADNALDAPPPPSMNRSPGSRRLSATIKSYDIADPARPSWLLPTQTSILTSHMQIRDRVIECLQTFDRPGQLSSLTPVITRLVESVLASSDNMYEIYGDQIGVAISSVAKQHTARRELMMSPRPTGQQLKSPQLNRPSQGTADDVNVSYACLRGFRSGPWGYESEVGVTTLLRSVVARSGGASDMSSDQQSSGSMPMASGVAAGDDFASTHMRAAEFDWLLTLCPVPARFLAKQPISTIGNIGAAMGESSTSLVLYQQPVTPYTKLVDDAIQLFGHIFPTLSENAQLTILDDLVLRLNRLPFNSHRYLAVLTNILSALYAAMQGGVLVRQGLISLGHNGSSMQQQFEIAPRVARAVIEMTRAALILPSPEHRLLAGEVIGHLATFTRDASTSYLPYLLEHLTNQAIRSRDRFARAGTAVALGSLYSRAGSIVAGGLLRQVVVLLHSLASDKDPIVHTWAISALAEAAMSAGFMFEPHARDTFQMALKLFLSDSHAFPLYASAQWIRGKEHMSNTATDCASYERVLPLRSMTDPTAWAKQAAAAQQQQSDGAGNHRGLGNIVTVSRDAAITHPNSTTHHGRSGDEQRDAMAAAATGAEGDYQYVCARSDVDTYDARAAIGHLVSSLILVFGPELQVDDATRDSVTTLLRQLHRALPSIGVPVPAMGAGLQLSPIVDPDARWQTVAEFVFATQKQLLFFPPKQPEFLPLLVRQSLRPILQTRRTTYYGYSSSVHSFQHVAVLALDSVLRLYGDRIFESLQASHQEYWADWSMDDIVWESLALHNTVREQISVSGTERDSTTLLSDLRKLVHSVISLVVGHDYRRLEALCAMTDECFDETGEKAQAICNILDLVETLCAVFTKRAGAVPTLGSRHTRRIATPNGKAADAAADHSAAVDDVRPFNAETKKLAIAAIISILDVIEQARPPVSSLNQLPRGKRHWRSHPLISLLADLVRVGYMAATSPVAESATLCCLGLHLLQRLIAQFCDVEDPEMPGEGMPILAIYQAQLNSAFMPALSSSASVADGSGSGSGSSSSSGGQRKPSILKQAAMGTATAYVVSGLITDRGSLVRIVRLLAPQTALKSSAPGTPGAKHRFNATGDPLDSSTPQMHIITKLSILHTWSVILDHAVKTRSESLLDIVQLHMPVLSTMWLDAVRDTAVIGVKLRDILDELDSLSQFTNTSAGKIAPDVGLGLSLGLESTYLGLVSKSLNTWYRYHLPLFLRSLSMLLSPETSGSGSHKVVSVLKSGHDELLGHLQNTLPVRIPSALDLQMPSQSSVLLLGFVLQEISRLSGLSLSNAFAKHLPNGHVGDPLIQPIINRLVTGALDIGGSDQSGQGDSESERIASLVQAGIPMFGPTSLTSNVGMKWASDIRLLSSLLSALCALLQQSGDLGFASLFAATATAGETARGSWLVDEIWKQAVAIPLRPLLASTSSSGKDQLSSFSRGDLNPVVKQQLDNCQMRVDVAVKALAVAQSLLDCLRAAREPINGQISGLSRWFFCGSTAVNSDSLIGSLGMTGFGNTVLADMFGVWKFARSQIVESNNGTEGDVGSITVLASQSLAVITEIIAEAVYSVTSDSVESQRSLVSLWLNLWQESVFVAGTPQTAFASLHGFVSRVMDSHAATTQSYVDDILTGGSIDDDQGNSRTVQVVTAAVNRALLELLDSDEVSLATRSLALTAKLLAHDPSEPGHLVVAGDVATKFVSVFIAHLSDDTLLSAVLDVPGYMASPSKSTFAGFPAVLSLMPMLAKNAIPQLAAVVARNLPIPKADSSSVIDKSLGALVMFAATEYAEPRISESVLSTVLMLLLSMLPDNCSRLSTTEVKITESILSLAAASPTTFKSILLKLNASQPLAKRRLEAAIRSRAERGHDSDDDQEQVTATSSGEVSGRQTPMVSAGGGDKNVPGRIALKSDFAGF